MGRTAKHLTLSAKKAASRLASKKYASSTRGRETRHIARRTTRPAQRINIPQWLVDLATQHLPTSYLFQQAASDPDAVDESDLPAWDHPPPYTSPPPLATPEETRFTQNLVDVMHGRCLRESRAREKARMEIGMARDEGELIKNLSDQVQQDLDGCLVLSSVVRDFKGCQRHLIMANHLLQWSARSVHSMNIELEAAQKGMSSYVHLYHTRYAST
ncbi:hypothetical protein HWV62_34615 [Athelia sp. TMB]|nr:hypothetical protein HWV62_34615 [Athelia sp. TMB]